MSQQYLREVQYKDPSNLQSRADLHLRYSNATEPWYSWVLRQIDWPDGARVLEAGCGPGWIWAEEAATLPDTMRLTLTDLSEGMVDAARRLVASLSRFELADAAVADAQALPFADRTFDVAVANHMLYHVPDPSRALAELARVLRPGGLLLATANGPAHLRELWEVRSEVFGGPPTSPLIAAFGSLTGLPMVAAHFEQAEWRAYDDGLRCTDAGDVVAFITSAPPADRADARELASLRRVVEQRVANGDGTFMVSKESGIFVASKA